MVDIFKIMFRPLISIYELNVESVSRTREDFYLKDTGTAILILRLLLHECILGL